MSDFFTASGPFIFVVLLLGAVALVAAGRYLLIPTRSQLSLAIGGTTASVIVGLLATVTGFQRSASSLGQVAAGDRWIVLLGLKEASYNLVAALGIAVLVCLMVTVGAWRSGRGQPTAVGSESAGP